MTGKLGKEALKFAVSLAKVILSQLSTKATLFVIDNFERRIYESGAGARVIRARKGFTLIISNEDMDDIIRIIKSLEN